MTKSILNDQKSPSKFTKLYANNSANKLIITTNNKHQNDPFFLPYANI